MPSPKSIIVDGISFKSIRSACNYYSMYHHTVIHRINKGWTLEEAFGVSDRIISNKCKGKVYKIINNINSKVYIGITTGSLNKRLRQHRYNAEVKCKNTKLCKAIRLYGIECFKIELINKSRDRHRLSNKEAYYITKFDSINSGYNSIKGGGGLGDNYGHEITYKNKTYRSKVELAAYLGIPVHNIYRRINKGLPIDKHVNRSIKPRILYRNKVYGLTELSRLLDVDICTLKYRLSKNYCLNGPPKMTGKKDYYLGQYIERTE